MALALRASPASTSPWALLPSDRTLGASHNGLYQTNLFVRYKKTPQKRGFFVSGGEGGIRTLDGLLTHTPLAGERLQPLGHLSKTCHFNFVDTWFNSLPWERVIPGILPSTPSGPSSLRCDVLIRSRRISQPLGHLSVNRFFPPVFKARKTGMQKHTGSLIPGKDLK